MYRAKYVELKKGNREWVQAELTEGLTPKVLKLFKDTWVARLKQQSAPDSHWNWPELWRENKDGKSVFLSLECEGDLQGLIWLDCSGIPSRLSPGQPLIYVQRVSIAPWNRSAFGTRRFQPVGMILLREAVELSMDLGWSGKIGLHSLETAANWYRNIIGMTLVEEKDAEHENLGYFEFTSKLATRFLQD